MCIFNELKDSTTLVIHVKELISYRRQSNPVITSQLQEVHLDTGLENKLFNTVYKLQHSLKPFTRNQQSRIVKSRKKWIGCRQQQQTSTKIRKRCQHLLFWLFSSGNELQLTTLIGTLWYHNDLTLYLLNRNLISVKYFPLFLFVNPPCCLRFFPFLVEPEFFRLPVQRSKKS